MSKIINAILLLCAAAFCGYFYAAINSEGEDARPGRKTASNSLDANAISKDKTTAEIIPATTSLEISAQDGAAASAAITVGSGFTGAYVWRPVPDCVSDGCAVVWLSVEQSGRNIIFGIDANRGAPSYNMGTIYPIKVNLSGNKAIYKNSEYGDCEFTVEFSAGKAVVFPAKDLSDCWAACGFGYGVCVGGEYIKENSDTPDFEHFGPTNVGKPVNDTTIENE